MFFIIERSEETTLEFSQNSVSIMYNVNIKYYKIDEWFKQQRIWSCYKKWDVIESQTAKYNSIKLNCSQFY